MGWGSKGLIRNLVIGMQTRIHNNRMLKKFKDKKLDDIVNRLRTDRKLIERAFPYLHLIGYAYIEIFKEDWHVASKHVDELCISHAYMTDDGVLHIETSRPGIFIGKKGEHINAMRQYMQEHYTRYIRDNKPAGYPPYYYPLNNIKLHEVDDTIRRELHIFEYNYS